MQKPLSLDGLWQYQLDPQATKEAGALLASADGWPTAGWRWSYRPIGNWAGWRTTPAWSGSAAPLT